jgi:hypothetical protein
VYNPAAAPLAGITGGGYTPSGAMRRDSTHAAAAAELHAAVFGAGLPLPPPPLRVGLRAAARALPPNDPRNPKTPAEEAYAKFLKGVMAHQPVSAETSFVSSPHQTPRQSGASAMHSEETPGGGGGGGGGGVSRFRSTLNNVIMPSISMSVVHSEAKKGLLHDPDMTKKLYANEKGARLAGGGSRKQAAQALALQASPGGGSGGGGRGALPGGDKKASSSLKLDLPNQGEEEKIRAATGEEIFSPRTTVVINPVGRAGGGVKVGRYKLNPVDP